mmetsp:Transcript_30705/g.67358  ORF Transcript_30705/g.67358 Transcript_30705/m.67358 type:complete len:187 (+) Transcript_30705:10-570(+)
MSVRNRSGGRGVAAISAQMQFRQMPVSRSPACIGVRGQDRDCIAQTLRRTGVVSTLATVEPLARTRSRECIAKNSMRRAAVHVPASVRSMIEIGVPHGVAHEHGFHSELEGRDRAFSHTDQGVAEIVGDFAEIRKPSTSAQGVEAVVALRRRRPQWSTSLPDEDLFVTLPVPMVNAHDLDSVFCFG